MEFVKKFALSLTIILLLSAGFAYAQDTNQPPPPSQQQQPSPPPPPPEQQIEPAPPEVQGPGPLHPMGENEGRQRGMGREMIRDRFRNMETEITSWLEKNEPNTAKELSALKESNPRAYMRRLTMEMRKYREIMDAQQTNPALAELLKKDLGLKEKRNELLEKYKAATDEKQKKELMSQLKDVISERFDLIIKKKQLKYEELKKKLEELQNNVKSSQAELENYKKNKDELIKQHLDELVNKTGQFDWD